MRDRGRGPLPLGRKEIAGMDWGVLWERATPAITTFHTATAIEHGEYTPQGTAGRRAPHSRTFREGFMSYATVITRAGIGIDAPLVRAEVHLSGEIGRAHV